jgi:sortase (surface protein transpeptidase)
MRIRFSQVATKLSLPARIVACLFACSVFGGSNVAAEAATTTTTLPISTLAPSKHDRLSVGLLILPSYGVTSKIVAEGVNRKTNTVEVPLDPRLVGWFSRGSQPGDVGTALFFGHRAKNGAFWHVPDMKKGTKIQVKGLNGVVTTWKVSSLQTIAKNLLPQTLFQIDGPPKLALVTCGGDFDYRMRHYLDNVIAWADPVKK